MTRPEAISTSTRDATAPPARKKRRCSVPTTSTTSSADQLLTARRDRADQAAHSSASTL